MADLIDRDKVIEAIDDISIEIDEGYGFQYEKWRKYFCELSSADLSDYCDKLWKLAYERGRAESEPRPISYLDCSNAMLKMWMDNVLTDGEYNRIMDKLNAKHAEDMRGDL